MNEYVIFTDSGSDIKPAMLAEWGVPCCSLTFRFTDADTEYGNDDMDIKTFYDKMRAGGVAKTAAINSETFAVEFEKILSEGRDLLYIGFSSGLSTTYNSARLAAEALREKYPARKIITVDSLAASAGQGLLVYLALQKKAEGASIEETAAYVEKIKLNICHWFTVDDLVYLKRGGRISPTAAFFGNALGIKPVMHVDNEGHLVNVQKVRGRRAALAAIVDKYGETACDPAGGTVFISQADCLSEVQEMAASIKEKYGADVKVITDVGTVIGAHSGPGTVALFFVGRER